MFSRKVNASKLDSLIFRLYDSDSDGHIDFKDLVTVAYAISEGTEEEKLKQVLFFGLRNTFTTRRYTYVLMYYIMINKYIYMEKLKFQRTLCLFHSFCATFDMSNLQFTSHFYMCFYRCSVFMTLTMTKRYQKKK